MFFLQFWCVGAVFSFFVNRQHVFFVLFVCVVAENHPPGRIDDLFSGGLEIFVPDFGHYRCVGHFAIGVKHGNETSGHQVVDSFLVRRDVVTEYTCRDDGMVVGNFFIVEHFGGFAYFTAFQYRFCQGLVRF